MPLIIAAALVAGGTYMAAKSQKAPKQAAGVDVGAATGDAIRGNIENAPEAEYLARRTNNFNQSQNLSLLEKAIPGYSDWSKQMAGNASAYASGKISDEQAGNLTRLAAERGISTGVRGQANDFSLLRDFGIDQYQANGQSASIMTMLAGLNKVNPMSPLSQYATPGMAMGAAQQNQANDQAYLNAQNAYQNQQAAAPWTALAAGAGAYMGAAGGGAGAAAGAASSFKGGGSTGYGGGVQYQNQPFMQKTDYSHF